MWVQLSKELIQEVQEHIDGKDAPLPPPENPPEPEEQPEDEINPEEPQPPTNFDHDDAQLLGKRDPQNEDEAMEEEEPSAVDPVQPPAEPETEDSVEKKVKA